MTAIMRCVDFSFSQRASPFRAATNSCSECEKKTANESVSGPKGNIPSFRLFLLFLGLDLGLGVGPYALGSLNGCLIILKSISFAE